MTKPRPQRKSRAAAAAAPPTDWIGDGFGTALVTPFTPDLTIDLPALVRAVQHVVRGGADFVVVLGSTGEAAMLSDTERDEVVVNVKEHLAGPDRGSGRHARLVVGAGATGTAQACAFAERAAVLGADALLVVAPPYVKPTADGIVLHFAEVADAARGVPICAYNVPSRTGVDLVPTIVQRLWELPAVTALKESSGNLLQIARIAAALPPGTSLLAGDDALLLPSVAVGARGVVSVAGNVAPAAVRDLLAAARAGDLPRAQALQRALLPLFDALFAEPNPIPVKAALSLLGIAGPDLRLPLTTATAATRRLLQQTLEQFGEVHHA
jgi:4-hydroxy-tetrahydrodipicolinate synthase